MRKEWFEDGFSDDSAEEQNQLKKRIPDFDRTYTINIFNTNAFPVTVKLFGAKEFLYSAVTGIPAGVLVDVPESSYDELMQESMYRPFTIGGSTIQANFLPQLQQIPVILYRDPAGVRAQYPFQTFNYFSIFQFQNNFIEIFPISITITGDKQIQFFMLPLAIITVTLYVKKRVDFANELHNEPVLEENDNLYPYFKSELTITA